MAQPNVQRGGSYIPNGPMPNPAPGATPLLPNQGRIVQSGSTKVLCIADVRGNLQSLNELARKNNANCIVHTGDFGFYDDSSLTRIAEKTLKHVAQYSPLLNDVTKRSIAATAPGQSVKDRFVQEKLPLSELPRFLTKELKLEIPVYTVWGACEDVQVLEKLRSKEYEIENLHLIDEAHSRLLEVGGVKLRLLGLGGAVVMHKLFDNGEGRTTIAGGQGTMWTTLLQMGELVDTANRVYDPTETRIFVTHASPAREGLLNQLSVTLKADFSISAGLHFRYGSSYNEFSVNPTLDHYRGKLAASKASFNDVWETVKSEVEPAVSENEAQQRLLQNALEIVGKMPTVANGGNPFGGPAGGHAGGQVDESAFKNMWNFNLADAAYGQLILEIEGGRIATEMKAQGFNFAHRGGKVQPQQPTTAQTATAVPNAAQATNQSRQATVATPPIPATQPKASPAAPRDTPKPATPQPAASGSDKGVTETRTNGTPSAETKPAEPASSPAPRFEEKKSGLFINSAADEETAKSYLAEEDRAKITKIEGRGTNRFALLFENNEDRDAALGRVPAEHKTLVAMLRDQPRSGPKGFWRSGAPAGGYRSGGGSDSEGGRGGRGSFRGGRGRGDRGRGRGRGRGGAGEAASGGGDA